MTTIASDNVRLCCGATKDEPHLASCISLVGVPVEVDQPAAEPARVIVARPGVPDSYDVPEKYIDVRDPPKVHPDVEAAWERQQTKPSLRSVPSPSQARAIELLEGVLERVRTSSDTRDIVIAVQYGTRMSTRYTGSVVKLLGLAARLTHDLNRDIDEDND